MEICTIQVKIPAERVLKKAPPALVKHGIIGQEELLLVREAAAKILHKKLSQLGRLRVAKKSVDARKGKKIQFVYRVEILPAEGKGTEPKAAFGTASISAEKKGLNPLVVGFGPAGMFAALALARAGLCPVVAERGLSVKERQQEVERFFEGGLLNTECNVQFGEGGAGTFSDGKLNTMVKDRVGRSLQVLQTLVQFGAPSEILYLQKPHIGTDRLKDVVTEIRREIERLGGTVLFGTRLEEIKAKDGKLTRAVLSKDGKEREMPCDCLVLAIGHSARDTFYKLKEQGIMMQQKAFAIGVRVEHPQEMIGKNQYGCFYKALPAADYKVTHQTAQGRGVYSFCMCPGGYVVNASSEKGMLAVNGMSDYDRDGVNANSAIVVTVPTADFGSDDVLAGIAYQRKYERAAFALADGKIPVQLFADFLQGRDSTSFGKVIPQTKGQFAFGNVRAALPREIADAVAQGMAAFDRRIPGFAREDAVLAGIESRTSSPVRIVRDEALQSNIRGLYPCGEGAGYAGGITSAAMDGLLVAEQIIRQREEIV